MTEQAILGIAIVCLISLPILRDEAIWSTPAGHMQGIAVGHVILSGARARPSVTTATIYVRGAKNLFIRTRGIQAEILRCAGREYGWRCPGLVGGRRSLP